MPEGILIIFNLATLKLSEIDNISVKNVKHVKSPVNLLFPVETGYYPVSITSCLSDIPSHLYLLTLVSSSSLSIQLADREF